MKAFILQKLSNFESIDLLFNIWDFEIDNFLSVDEVIFLYICLFILERKLHEKSNFKTLFFKFSFFMSTSLFDLGILVFLFFLWKGFENIKFNWLFEKCVVIDI